MITVPFKAITAMCAMVCIVVAYGIFMMCSPSNGVLFGTVMLAIGALGGVTATEVLKRQDK